MEYKEDKILIRQANHNRNGVDIHTFHQTLFYYRHYIRRFNEQANKIKAERDKQEIRHTIKRIKQMTKELQMMANGFGISKHFRWWLGRMF